VFLKTYAPKVKAVPISGLKPANVLDRWIISRLVETMSQTTSLLEKYDITAAARLIESFTINDLSLWYVRRSRRRLQQPKNAAELNQAAKVFASVLSGLAKISAPFIPFLAEEIYQEISGNNYIKAKSVHLEPWPQASTGANKELNAQMEQVRLLVTQALAQRAQRGVKVRQPLAKLTVKEQLSQELRDLLAQEVNVKSVEFNPDIKESLEIDWNLTPALKEEGQVREIMRNIQDLRKTADLTPSDAITIYVEVEGEAASGQSEPKSELAKAIEHSRDLIIKETKAKILEFGKPKKFTAGKEAVIGDLKMWIGIKKMVQ
jgi:isoleucyl-tRNA synthetase